MGTHNGETVKTFLNACVICFILTVISYENTKDLFAKSRLLSIAHTWYFVQGYNETMVTFVNVNSHMLDYFIPYDYIRRDIRALLACKIG